MPSATLGFPKQKMSPRRACAPLLHLNSAASQCACPGGRNDLRRPPCTRRRACRLGAGARGGRAQQGGGYMRPTSAVCRPPAEVGQALESRARPRRGEARQPRQRGRLSDENTTPSEHVASKVTNAPASCRAAGAGRLMPHHRRPPRQAPRRACRRASGRAATIQAHG